MKFWTPFLAAALLILHSAAALAETRVALVVGNNAYRHVGSLRNPINDAQDISETLRGLGFKVFTLTDQTEAAFLTAFDAFEAELDNADAAFFYYSGHGVEIEGRNYVVAVDAQVGGSAQGFVQIDSLLERMRAKSKVSVALLDACRDNPMAGVSFDLAGVGQVKAGRGLQPVGLLEQNQAASSGLLIGFAAAPGRVAEDGQGDNSPYAAALLRNLPRAGVSIENAIKQANREVGEITQGRQVPWINSSLTRDYHLRPFQAGESFTDCETCPEMIPIPGRTYAMGKYEITFDEWEACLEAGGCGSHRPPDQGWGRGDRPMLNVNYKDAQLYLAHLSNSTGQYYRLPEQHEWRHAALGGANTRYPWGDEVSHEHANYGQEECCGGHAEGRDAWADQTAPVGSFPPNSYGLHDMLGNLWEWTEACDEQALKSDVPLRSSRVPFQPNCSKRIALGGSWFNAPYDLTINARFAVNAEKRTRDVGFRVVRDLGVLIDPAR
ncbi:MAG: SUMF1/EgtB/PvdO family nonheme iron enzyme [Rhodobacteraceae bacterium]|nr:SUMF1/EgtB/PvdO family nonheme iron enzyme [Paracoccaceae bacterium]